VKKDEMGGLYSMHEREEKFVQNFGWKIQMEENLKDVGVDAMVILKWILEK
jgi:hypothetical protein